MNREELGFSIKMGGQDEVDARLFADILNGVLDLSLLIAKDQGDSSDFNIVVKDTQKGSFIIELMSQVSFDPNLFNMQNMQYMKTILDMIVTFFNIKKHLKGDKPKKVESSDEMISIQNMENCTINVTKNEYNLYAEAGDKMIAQMFPNYNKGEFVITYDSEPKLCVKSNEIIYMKEEIDLEPFEDYREIENIPNLWLHIKKPDFIGNSKWDFVYSTHKSSKTIGATIEDKAFLNLVKNGEVNINAKTSILAKVHIVTHINELNEIINEKFSVVEVLEIKNSTGHTQLGI
ncbi:hypothetical protein PBV87_15495 [Niameybacter massiliensis]|uniref:Uncharacterized protein n=1 Tax=Holtiella tumoricola TaxID=3018743 RepID=A0AA42DPR2_9FIRM|nr:hypothetical protein [Holtiella tumoricola]MDA3732880.1 hypothetical protein [Holtiella tumoricola]